MRSAVSRSTRTRLFATSSGPIKKTSLNQWHKDRGARMVEFCGWEMPVQYKDTILASHMFTREKSTVFDVSHMLQLELRGKDSVDFLESLVVADVRGLGAGRACLSLLLTEQGTILDDTVITRHDDRIYMVVNAGCADKDWAHMQNKAAEWRAKGKQVNIVSLSEGNSLLALQGPRAAEVLSRGWEGGAESLRRIPFLGSASGRAFGVPCYITRCGYTGEDGFEISMPHSKASAVADALCSDASVCLPAGLGARDTLRLEAGLCLYGNDIDDTVTPAEAALGWTVPETRRREQQAVKFPGWKRVVDELKDKSAKKLRVGILVDGRRPPAHPADIFKDGVKVGRVTSGTVSPILEKGIGMAYLDKPHNLKKTTGLYIEVRGKKLDISVGSLPHVPTKYYVME